MSVTRLDDAWLAVAPAEGPGRVYEYFRVTRLADSGTAISEATWAPLIANAPWHSTVDELPHGPLREDETWRQTLLRWSETIHHAERPEAGLAWLSAQVAGSELERVPALLTQYARILLEGYPAGSFWFLQTDELLGRGCPARRRTSAAVPVLILRR